MFDTGCAEFEQQPMLHTGEKQVIECLAMVGDRKSLGRFCLHHESIREQEIHEIFFSKTIMGQRDAYFALYRLNAELMASRGQFPFVQLFIEKSAEFIVKVECHAQDVAGHCVKFLLVEDLDLRMDFDGHFDTKRCWNVFHISNSSP